MVAQSGAAGAGADLKGRRGTLRELFTARWGRPDKVEEGILKRLEKARQISSNELPAKRPLPEVRAQVIEWLCKDPEAVAALGADGLELAHVAVAGPVNLDHVRLTVPFRAVDCTFAGEVSAINARFSLLELSMVKMGRLTADGLQVEGDIRLCNFQSDQEVRFAGATVGKDLYCVNAHFDNVDGTQLTRRVLNLDGASFGGSVYFREGEQLAAAAAGCTAHGEVNMLRVRVKGQVSCEHMDISHDKAVALVLDGARVEGNVALGPAFNAKGEVRLHGARVGGDLYCPSTNIYNSAGIRALTCDHAVIEGSVHLAPVGRGDGSVPLFASYGKVSFHSAQINGDVDCASARFCASMSSERERTALSFEAATIRGSLGIWPGTVIRGKTDLRKVAIGRNLELKGVEFTNAEGIAVDGDGARIGGMLIAEGQVTRVLGGLRLEGVKIDRDLDLHQLHVIHPQGRSIDAAGIEVNGSLLMTEDFHSEGTVWLRGAKVRLDVRADGGEFQQTTDGSRQSLVADGAAVGGSVILDGGFRASGRLTFQGASIGGAFVWNPEEPQEGAEVDLRSATAGAHGGGGVPPGRVLLDGYVYQRLRREMNQTGREDETTVAKDCLRWIERQSAQGKSQQQEMYWAQPYEQLATVLKNMGYLHAARLVMIKKNEAYAGLVKLEDSGWLWYKLFGKYVVDYGYNPWRAVWGSFIVIAIGTFFFWLNRDSFVPVDKSNTQAPGAAGAVNPQVGGKVESSAKERWIRAALLKASPSPLVPNFNPLIYSFEVFVPLLKFDQAAKWTLNRDSNGCLWCYWYAHIISGWVLTSLWIGAFAGLTKT